MKGKPKITIQLYRWLYHVDEYIRKYDCRGDQVLAAASDVFDGWLTRKEVEPLVRRRMLTVICIPAGEWAGHGLLGDRVTVEFTHRAARLLWAERLDRAAERETPR